jgi:hypothetical protein
VQVEHREAKAASSRSGGEGGPGMGMGGMGMGGGPGLGMEYEYLAPGRSDGFGLHKTVLRGGTMIPPLWTPPLMVGGSGGVFQLDTPDDLELPGQLYLTSVDLGMPVWRNERTQVMLQTGLRLSGEFNARDLQYTFGTMVFRKWSERLSVMGSGGFRMLCNFEQIEADQFEPVVFAMADYDWSERFHLMLGAVYLGSDAPWPLLPIAGFRWSPTERWRVEVMLPQPRLAYRLSHSEQRDWWLYLAGATSGNTWYVERPDRVTRAVRYSDFQLRLGLERQASEGISSQLEVGYAFERSLKIDRENIDRPFGGTISARAAFHY